MLNLTYIQIINHAHRRCQRVQHRPGAAALSFPMTYPSFCCCCCFFLFLSVNLMCFKRVFARVHWPLNTGGELLNSSPLQPSQLSPADPFNRCLPGLLELNHNYLASSDGGESVHCVIPISPLDMKNAPRNQKREHYVGLTDLTGEAEFETGLRSSLSLFRCSFSPALYLLIPSLPLYFLLYVSNPPCFRRPSYYLWFSLRIPSIFPH